MASVDSNHSPSDFPEKQPDMKVFRKSLWESVTICAQTEFEQCIQVHIDKGYVPQDFGCETWKELYTQTAEPVIRDSMNVGYVMPSVIHARIDIAIRAKLIRPEQSETQQ